MCVSVVVDVLPHDLLKDGDDAESRSILFVMPTSKLLLATYSATLLHSFSFTLCAQKPGYVQPSQ